MTKTTYSLLIYRSSPGEADPERANLALSGHRALQAEAAAHKDLHAVARLDQKRDAKTISFRDGAHSVTDGPYIETKEWLVGFYLIDCQSEVEALERARMICMDADHVIEVRAVKWRWLP